LENLPAVDQGLTDSPPRQGSPLGDLWRCEAPLTGRGSRQYVAPEAGPRGSSRVARASERNGLRH
jgi:hypothetical protein